MKFGFDTNSKSLEELKTHFTGEKNFEDFLLNQAQKKIEEAEN